MISEWIHLSSTDIHSMTVIKIRLIAKVETRLYLWSCALRCMCRNIWKHCLESRVLLRTVYLYSLWSRSSDSEDKVIDDRCSNTEYRWRRCMQRSFSAISWSASKRDEKDLFDSESVQSDNRYQFRSSMSLCAFKSLLMLVAEGLIVLNLCLRRWTILHCLEIFDTLIKQFFQQRREDARYSLKYICNVIKCWLSDDCYDVLALEAALRNQFEHDRRMFDKLESIFEMKIVVIAMSIFNATLFLFSNYNGTSFRIATCDRSRFKRKSSQILRLHVE